MLFISSVCYSSATKVGKCWQYTGKMLQNHLKINFQVVDLPRVAMTYWYRYIYCIFKTSISRHLLLALYSSKADGECKTKKKKKEKKPVHGEQQFCCM